MARTTDKFELPAEDYEFLQEFTKSGTAKVRQIKRGLALLKLHEGLSIKQISKDLGLSESMLYLFRRKYLKEGLQTSLHDKARSGRPRGITGRDRAKVTALACSDAPKGHARWTLRLLADKAVELGYIEKGSLSHESVSQILKKTNSGRI